MNLSMLLQEAVCRPPLIYMALREGAGTLVLYAHSSAAAYT